MPHNMFLCNLPCERRYFIKLLWSQWDITLTFLEQGIQGFQKRSCICYLLRPNDSATSPSLLHVLFAQDKLLRRL